MSRLCEIFVKTNITDLPHLLGEHHIIPKKDMLEVSKYAKDCHELLFKLLLAEKIPNPNERSRFYHVPRGKLMLLRASWENYMLDYHKKLVQKTVIIQDQTINLHTLFWRNLCVLHSIIILRKYKGAFPYDKACDLEYVRRNLLCVSKKSIGDYSMSELMCAMRVWSKQCWSLTWDRCYVDYLFELEFAVSEYVSWLGTEENKHLYDEGCKRAKDMPHYGVSMECSAQLAEWFYIQKKRMRLRMMIEKWLQPKIPLLPEDEAAVRRLDTLLREKARGVHDMNLLLKPLKELLLALCVEHGESERYTQEHGNKNASTRDILREFRPTNYIAYREDELFEVKNIIELLDSPICTVRPFRELLQLYLINLTFDTTDGCHFKWMMFHVALELDLERTYRSIKNHPEPVIIQSFQQWFVCFEQQLWLADSLLHAFIGWSRLLMEKRQNRMFDAKDIRPILDQIFIETSTSPDNNDNNSIISAEQRRYMIDASDWI